MFKTNRKTDYPVLELILNRWSARSFSTEPISDLELMTIFDAARWAQNSFDNQPWRFIYARHGSDHWQKLVNLLVPANKVWAQHARVLVLVISKKTFDYNESPSRTHSFDTGAACQNMALQAAYLDIVCHGMEGFDYEAAKTVFNISDIYQVEAMFALGKLGDKKDLPEKLQVRENPSNRKPLTQVVFEGNFYDE